MVWSKVRHRDEPGWPVADVADVVQDVTGAVHDVADVVHGMTGAVHDVAGVVHGMTGAVQDVTGVVHGVAGAAAGAGWRLAAAGRAAPRARR
jgi:prophage DNA circulation protein